MSNYATQSWRMIQKRCAPHLGYGFIGAAVKCSDEKARDISEASAEDNLSNIPSLVMRCPLMDSKSCSVECWCDSNHQYKSPRTTSTKLFVAQCSVPLAVLHLFRRIENFARALSC